MSAFLASYVCTARHTNPPSERRIDALRRRWRRLAGSLLDPYRPELHYMRGPGPKWRQKHATTGSSPGA